MGIGIEVAVTEAASPLGKLSTTSQRRFEKQNRSTELNCSNSAVAPPAT